MTKPRLSPSAFWNEDPRFRWLDAANVGQAYIDGILTTSLIDGGAQMNLVTPEFMKARGLDVFSIQDLNEHDGFIPINSCGGKITKPLGYVIIRVQIPYVPSYNEEQVALVVEDPSTFSRRCPVILGTPTINRAVRSMKESEMQNAPEEWQKAKAAYEFVYFRAQYEGPDNATKMPTNTRQNPVHLDEKVMLKRKYTIPAFATQVVHCWTKETMMGYCLHVMTQAPYPEDGAHLLIGVYVLKTYTELKDGCQNVSIVLRNLMGKPVHLASGRVVARVLAANIIPEVVPSPAAEEKLNKLDPEGAPKKLTVEERQQLLMELLRKDGGLSQLNRWDPEMARQFELMLMENHHIFSLDSNKIGCTNTAKHVIELLDEEPFKERFHRIAPPLLEEVRQNIQDMLDGGAIRLSQSPWCNVVVLVRKKDGMLRFCIDFQRLNARMLVTYRNI